MYIFQNSLSISKRSCLNYDFLTLNRYKERFKEKYITKNPNNTEKLLNAKQWIFIKDGLDDFRDGLPPPHKDLIIKVI
jgi:hypothetical protein